MASAPCQNVLEATAALSCEFPDRAVSIPLDIFDSESFRNTLSEFIVQASSESFDQFVAKASKGGVSVTEEREVCNPSLVNGMLMSFLEGLGSFESVPRLKKNVRDDVILEIAAVVWRRSPYWLMLRVMVERQLCTERQGSHRAFFKFLLCAVFAKLLEDCSTVLHPEKVNMLIAKLARRLAKLEEERQAASGEALELYNQLFKATTHFFESALKAASDSIALACSSFKRKNRRFVPRLNREVPQMDLRFDFSGSIDYLRALLSVPPMAHRPQKTLVAPYVKEGTILQVQKMASRFIDTDPVDADFGHAFASMKAGGGCARLARSMINLANHAVEVYKGDSILMSRSLLTLFQRWVEMDKLAISVCPIIKDYKPLFNPRALDVLCLSSESDMQILRQVQQYLDERSTNASKDYTFLSRPNSEDSFPQRYYLSDQGSSFLVPLEEHIDSRNEDLKTQKIEQFDDMKQKYERLSAQVQQETCICTWDDHGVRNCKKCTKCFHDRQRNRMKIQPHEDLLPDKEKQGPARAAVLLELAMPKVVLWY